MYVAVWCFNTQKQPKKEGTVGVCYPQICSKIIYPYTSVVAVILIYESKSQQCVGNCNKYKALLKKRQLISISCYPKITVAEHRLEKSYLAAPVGSPVDLCPGFLACTRHPRYCDPDATLDLLCG